MSKRVSWRPEYSQRLYGTFVRWRDGHAVVRRGGRLHYLAPSELTWES